MDNVKHNNKWDTWERTGTSTDASAGARLVLVLVLVLVSCPIISAGTMALVGVERARGGLDKSGGGTRAGGGSSVGMLKHATLPD